MDNKGSNNNRQNNNNKNGMTIMIFILVALIVLFVASIISSGISKMTNQEVSYSEFKKMVADGKVKSIEFSSGRIDIEPKTESGKIPLVTYYAVQLGNDDSLYPLLDEYNVDYRGIPTSTMQAFMYNILSIAIPILILWIALGFIMRRMGGGGGVMGVGKSTAKVYVEKETGVTFKDVAGQDEAKESLQEVVDFLHNPKKYTEIGAKLPKGALLVGPPGTGKTLLAKAVAGEAKVPFFSLAGSDFVEMFVGVGASRVRDLFKEAQKQAPCIIFIDEIDAIGKSRDTRYGGNDEREQTLNQLLAEMDGFDTSKGLLILAATNRPEVLDKALLRPGRFDRRIIVDKPDLKGRKETLRVHSKNVLMDDSVDMDAIALATSGAVGSDLANMINEAAINAVKNGRKSVNQGDLFESVEVVVAGKEKKDRIMGPKEKKMVAYHEVGHALVTALQKDAEPVQKITIVPRTMGALGYTMQVPEEEKFLMTKNELIAHLVTYMGGRAAEEIAFDSVTTGASNDIEQATKIARAMVTQYGMSDKFGLMGLVTVESQYLDGRASLNCGEETAAQIDKEVMQILQKSYATAKRLLEENLSILDEISEYLYEHETITGKEFMKIFRRLKGLPETVEDTDSERLAKQVAEMKRDIEEVKDEKSQKNAEEKKAPQKQMLQPEKEKPEKPVKELSVILMPDNKSQGQKDAVPEQNEVPKNDPQAVQRQEKLVADIAAPEHNHNKEVKELKKTEQVKSEIKTGIDIIIAPEQKTPEADGKTPGQKASEADIKGTEQKTLEVANKATEQKAPEAPEQKALKEDDKALEQKAAEVANKFTEQKAPEAMIKAPEQKAPEADNITPEQKAPEADNIAPEQKRTEPQEEIISEGKAKVLQMVLPQTQSETDIDAGGEDRAEEREEDMIMVDTLKEPLKVLAAMNREAEEELKKEAKAKEPEVSKDKEPEVPKTIEPEAPKAKEPEVPKVKEPEVPIVVEANAKELTASKEKEPTKPMSALEMLKKMKEEQAD